MNDLTQRAQSVIKATPAFLRKYWLHILALVLIAIWCLPYFTTGDRVEWGDFSFFSQGYEAMRISITEYHQFPWFNPWMSGGVPLYANPQMGLFSIQMLFTFFVSAPMALKIALAVYTFLGYGSMYLLLRKYFKIDARISVLLSLLWIFCTFFVSHLPTHFTFAWYMLAPAFIYLALTIKEWKGGLIFGAAFAIMAQSQIHNPFMHITLICGVILLFRFTLDAPIRKRLLLGLVSAGGAFLVLAGHRFLMTAENVLEFPRQLSDPPPHPWALLAGLIEPLSKAHSLHIFKYPAPPVVPHGFHETTGTIGIFALLAVFFSLLFLAHKLWLAGGKWQQQLAALKPFRLPILVFVVGLACFSLAFGSVFPLAPYSLLKHLPVFGDMRVPMRWLVWFDLGLLTFVGLMIGRVPKKSFIKFALVALLSFGVIEMFLMNAGYQQYIFSHKPITAPLPTSSYQFAQTAYFGQTRKLPGGGTIPNDHHMPAAYREYEATTFNLGVLYANDALVQLALDPQRNPGHPTCPWEEGCNFVHSGNAKVVQWTPQKIILERTAPGKVYLNMNNSNYFLINGKRNPDIRVAEPFTDFIINEPDSVKTITIQVKPSVGTFFHRAAAKL